MASNGTEENQEATAMADRTAATSSAQVDSKEPSKNALKKAQKQERLAAGKANKSTPNTASDVGRAEAKKAPKKKIEGAALIGIDVAKEDDFSGWYQQVLTKGDMLDYYDISGCYILKPASFFVWEEVQQWFNKNIKSIGVKNCAFPMFVSQDVLEQERAHIEGFAAEVAWVTHAGDSKLEKKIAIRPTSETVMYPYYAKWIRSHRDLPLRLNQWNSVVRWEFKHPQPFLRTREFLWQEGHTAHLTEEGAGQEVLQILDWYAGVYEDLLAVPVIKGRKTEKEKFAGGLYTTTVEGYIPSNGRGIQGGTSHCLGQNFSRMFGISVEDPSAKEGEKKPALYVWQNSWGLSTRVIGVMVMIHGDNRGLVLPPRVAEIQVVIVPVGITAKSTEQERQSIHQQVDAIAILLRDADIRVETDKREGYSPGWKFNEWEMRGVPLRLEFGPGESEGHYVTISRRDIPGKDGKDKIAISDLGKDVPALLDTIQSDLYKRAQEKFKSHTIKITKWDDFVPSLNDKNICLIPHCLEEKCEDEIKELSARKAAEDSDEPEDAKAPSMGAKSLCIPFEQPSEGIEEGAKCTNPNCENLAKSWCLFGRK
ncbi:MAG: hypothetical protein Q9185_001395 [Variospora sp. 1 TL-2023]